VPSTADPLAEIREGYRLFHMDIHKMLAELRTEHAQIGEVIMMMERLARGGGKRRGRPPKWLTEPAAIRMPGGKGKRRPFSKETRQKMAAAQKRRWAARKTASA
jgi:hypothetical protein